jgi:hypothetical protein
MQEQPIFLDTTRTARKTTHLTILCGVSIRCSGKVFAEPLPNNDRGIHIQTHRLMGRVYERRYWAHVPDMYTKFHKDWFRQSEFNGGGVWEFKDTQTTLRLHNFTLALQFVCTTLCFLTSVLLCVAKPYGIQSKYIKVSVKTKVTYGGVETQLRHSWQRH